MPTFLTLLSASPLWGCVAPPEDQHPSSAHPKKPKPTSQNSSGEKDIFISGINLGPGQEDLTNKMKDYLRANDYYSSTQCLVHGDNKISPDEAMKYTRVEGGALLADDFYREFPGYYLDFTKGNIGTYDSKEQSEEVFAIENGITAYLQQERPNISPEEQEQLTDGLIMLNEDIPGSVNPDTLNKMASMSRDCEQNLSSDQGEESNEESNNFARIVLGTLHNVDGLSDSAFKAEAMKSDGWAVGTQGLGNGNSDFEIIFNMQFVFSHYEGLEALQDYCNHPKDLDQILSEYFP